MDPAPERAGGGAARGTLVVVLLLLTLALAGGLTYQAIDSVASHRATAEAVMHDYAAFAAEEFASRAARELEYYGLYPPMQALLRAERRGAPVPPRAALVDTDDRSLDQAMALVHGIFRVDLGSRQLTTNDAPSDLPSWLGDSILHHNETAYDTTWTSAMIVANPGPEARVFAYVPYRAAAVGFELRADTLQALLRMALHRTPVLPPTLTRGTPVDSILAVRLLYASHEPFVELMRPPSDGGYAVSVRRPMPERFGGLIVETTIDEGATEELVIGGIPASRLPLIVLSFTVTAALIVAALYQIRRERELDRLRTEFVSNVSHELRTPLAQIRMFAETLLLDRVRSDGERRRSLAIVDKETRRLAHLVENLLHFSRADRRVVEITPEPTAIANLVADVIASFRPLAEAHDVRMTLQSPPIVATVDPSAVRQILLNLLDNAVKYGPSGQTVSVEARLDDQTVVITVEDEGPGIPEAHRHEIWERFGRLERERKSSVSGTGIGLAVVRQLTHLHRGRAWVEPGRVGARFAIALPHARPGEASTPGSDQPATPALETERTGA